MTLQDIANYGEILGATGVIASLIFVGWQINSNTKAARMRMHEQITQTYMSFLSSELTDPGVFAAGLKSESGDFSDLSDSHKMFFFGTMLGIFKHFELMYVQHTQGIMDKETWDSWSEHIRMYYHQPGAQTWWSLRKATFIPGFRAYLESSAPSKMTTFVELMSD